MRCRQERVWDSGWHIPAGLVQGRVGCLRLQRCLCEAGGCQQGAQGDLELAAWGTCTCPQGGGTSGCEEGFLGLELALFETSGVS